MAIHPDCEGIEARIATDVQTLIEHVDVTEESGQVHSVRSQAGKEYAIIIRHGAQCTTLHSYNMRAQL